jgi:ABC-type Mn2+/Zn2+ transport system permease subunit
MGTEAAVLAIATSVAAGLIGSFAVMRRMSLAADPLSHVALPGIGVALALHREPIFGAVAALLVGAFMVWVLEDKARAATESIIGVVFAAALAIGSLTTSGEDLIDALFGGGGAPTLAEIVFVLLAAIGIVAFVIAERNRLVVMIVSPDLARTAGVNVRRVDLAYLLLFALTIGIGLRYLGVLLMGALIIIPPVTAKGIARNLREMLTLSVVFAVLATFLGANVASWAQLAAGPVIVLIAAAGFLLSLLLPRGSAASSPNDAREAPDPG